MNKISIITPTFNSEKFIEDSIHSVLNQNYSNFEHIIIDGGSTDNTINILKKHKHLIWISEEDEGQTDALNKGFDIASGDIYGWLNSDDVYLRDTFFKIDNIFTKFKNIDAIYSNYFFGDENLRITKKVITHKPIRWLSLFHCYIPSTTFFFRSKIWENGIKLDKTVNIVMDKDFFASILFNDYKIKYVNDFFAIFRWHSSNKSLNSNEVKLLSAKESLLILNKHIRFKIPVNFFTIRLYRYIALMLNIYKVMKVFK